MTLKELDSKIAKLEGGKMEARIGDIRQIRKIIFFLIKNDADARAVLERFLARK